MHIFAVSYIHIIRGIDSNIVWKKKFTFIGTIFRCPTDYEFTIAGKILDIAAIQNPIDEKFLKYCLSEKIASH
jgi:hypothetical protein